MRNCLGKSLEHKVILPLDSCETGPSALHACIGHDCRWIFEGVPANLDSSHAREACRLG